MKLVVCCLIEKNKKFLLVQEKTGRAAGSWGLPGGDVKEGESLEEAVIREVKEETGLDVKLGPKIGIYESDYDPEVTLEVFSARVAGGKKRLNKKDHLDIGWKSLNEIERLSIRGKYIMRAIHDFRGNN